MAAIETDRLLERYIATAIVLYAPSFGREEDIASGIAAALIQDWDCPRDLADYVEARIPEIRIKLHYSAVAPFGAPPEYLPDELVELMRWRFSVLQGRSNASERALIEQLIAATRLYDTSEAVDDLVRFTLRMRAFAPFNAMLLHIQKPGLTHAATAQDWWRRFRRVPKQGVRPLLVLRTMGPVDFVFDILDTEGDEVPTHAFAFPTFGNLTETRFAEVVAAIRSDRTEVAARDNRDARAGYIRVASRSSAPKGKHTYQIAYNQNHPPQTRFVNLTHELAHLFLGHLGADKGRRVPDRRDTRHELREVDAEMAAYIVAKRNGLTPLSESYLAGFKGALEELDLYSIMRAANAVETAMGISAQALWNAKA